MPTINQFLLGAQQRLSKKRMREKKTPVLQGSPQKRGVCLRCIQRHLKNQTQLLEKLQKLG